MRPSANRHVLAHLRKVLKMNQTDFSEIVDCSASAIQAIELDRLKLSESLATRIEQATRASKKWLLLNDLSAPPITATGEPYTLEEYENWQAYKASTANAASLYTDIPGVLFGAYAVMRETLMSATRRGDKHAALYRLSRLLEEFKKEFTGERITHVPSYGDNTIELIGHDLAFVLQLVQRARTKPHQKSLLGPYKEKAENDASDGAAVTLIEQEMKAFLDAMDFHFARIAAANQGKMPKSCPIHLFDLALLQMGATHFPSIKKHGTDYFYRGVRLVEHEAADRVRRGVPTPLTKPRDAYEHFMAIFIPLYKHWTLFREHNGRKPTSTQIAPESLKTLIAGLTLPKYTYGFSAYNNAEERADLVAELPLPLRNDRGETVIYWEDTSSPIVMKVNTDLNGNEFRSV